MMIERRPITDRAEWLKWRKQYVTASQVPALFGAHPYLTALRLYMEKQGVEFEDKDSPVMRRGRILEPAVAAAAAEQRPFWQIEAPKAFYSDPDTRLAATPDFLVLNDTRGQGVLQAKTASPDIYAREWAGGTEVPFWIILQALTEAMLTDSAWAAVAVLSVDPYGLPCSIHEIARHPEAEAKILAAVFQFWDNVQFGIEPAADYGRDSALLKIIAPREAVPEKTIDLSSNNELPGLLEERALLKARIDSDKDRCEEIETQIKFTMRDASMATGIDGWRIFYKTTSFKGYTVDPRESRILRIIDKRQSR